jgi:hypothetical protein
MAAVALAGSAAAAAWALSPNAPEIAAQLRAQVKASRAHTKLLTVDVRRKRLRLVVSVADPSAYLEHRYERIVEAVYPRLERRVFRFTRLDVVDSRSRREVFSFTDAPGISGGWVTAWHIEPKLLDCARELMLPDYEVDPDQSAPACPAG